MPPLNGIKNSTEQFDALTGLRGFAALWVVAMHFAGDANLLMPATACLNWFTSAGFNAVAMFFVLSGFILLHTYRARFEVFSWPEYLRFLGLRLARIYPAYLAAMAAMVMLVVAAAFGGVAHSSNAYPFPSLPLEALMLHAWPPEHFEGWNYPDWSVSVEWFAYLFIFPLAVWLLKRLGGQNNIIVFTAALALLVAEPLVRSEWKIGMVSLLFLAGALLWEFRRRLLAAGSKLPPHCDSFVFGLLLAALWFGPALGKLTFVVAQTLTIGLLILGLSRADGIVSRLFATRVCVFLGEISYSIYLIHGVVLRMLKIAMPAAKFASASLPVRAGLLCADAAAVLLAAMLLHFAVERPARNWLRRKFARTNPKAEGTVKDSHRQARDHCGQP